MDYRTADCVNVIRWTEPGGLDAVFDGMGRDYLPRGLGLLKRGSVWVSCVDPRSVAGMACLLGRVLWRNLVPNGRRVMPYGTGASNLNRRPFLQDWAALFELLGAGQIRPIIAARFPLLEAAQAKALLESGQVIGNIVLLAPELLQV